ncbi:MAG: hypothetical protein AB7S26_27095 [Sandaracinaceae bacterium]
MRTSWIAIALMFGAIGCDDGRADSDAGARSDGSVPRSDGAAPESDGGSMGRGARIGDACTTDADCTEPAGARCYTQIDDPFSGGVVARFPNGMCSVPCDSSGDGSECGEGDVVCASVSMAGGMTSTQLTLCLPSCTASTECRMAEGYSCHTIFGFGYCYP